MLLKTLPEQILILKTIKEKQSEQINVLETSIDKLEMKKKQIHNLVEKIETETKSILKATSKVSSMKNSSVSDFFISSNEISEKISISSSISSRKIKMIPVELDFRSKLVFVSHIFCLHI